MSGVNSKFLDGEVFERRAVYPDERTYYKSDLESVSPDTAEVEAEIANNYLLSRRPFSTIVGIEIKRVESE